MERQDRILIVDDDAGIRDLLRQNLERYGFSVATAADGRAMRAALAAQSVDLVVLDLMLPGEDGLQLCRQLHDGSASPPPILMLTARGDETDRVLGLEMGADDYLVKPFSARELVARVRAILRRSRLAQAAPTPAAREATALPSPAPVLRFGGWRLDTCARHLLDADGAMVALSGAEFRLLRAFIEHPMRVLSRDQLLGLTQGRDSDSFDRSIDILVSRLRKRLGQAAFIRTVRSEGYMFAPAGLP